jgi:chromosomal replication initiation ATPase DnaA
MAETIGELDARVVRVLARRGGPVTGCALVAAMARVAAVAQSHLSNQPISIEALMGPRKDRLAARARWAIWLVLYDDLGWSLNAVGVRFNRDHTSVMHGVHQSRALLETDADFAALVDAVREVTL